MLIHFNTTRKRTPCRLPYIIKGGVSIKLSTKTEIGLNEKEIKKLFLREKTVAHYSSSI